MLFSNPLKKFISSKNSYKKLSTHMMEQWSFWLDYFMEKLSAYNWFELASNLALFDNQNICTTCCALIKKKIKFSSYIGKFRMEQLQSHIWPTASLYMGKYLRISSYIRKPFLIYDFATAPLWISLYMRKLLSSFLLVCAHISIFCYFEAKPRARYG
jgi:hypothetical protein